MANREDLQRFARQLRSAQHPAAETAERAIRMGEFWNRYAHLSGVRIKPRADPDQP